MHYAQTRDGQDEQECGELRQETGWPIKGKFIQETGQGIDMSCQKDEHLFRRFCIQGLDRSRADGVLVKTTNQ